jgi:hypothetical protein
VKGFVKSRIKCCDSAWHSCFQEELGERQERRRKIVSGSWNQKSPQGKSDIFES